MAAHTEGDSPAAATGGGDANEWLRFVTEGAGVGCWRWEPGAGGEWWSPLCGRLLGLGETAEGGDFLEAVHPEDRLRVRAAIEAAAAGGGAAEFEEEARVRSAEGVVRWVRVKGRAVIGGSGVGRIDGLVLDITEQKRREAELAAVEDRLNRVAEAARVVVWDMDVASGWTRCSPNAAEIWGFAEGPGEAFFERIHPEDRARVRPQGESGGGDERHYSREYRVVDLSGETRWLNSRGDVIADERGRPSRLVGVSVDITERKRVEQALRDSNERLERAQQAARLGTWDWDPRTGASFWSDGIYDLLGMPRQSFVPGFERCLGFIVPEDVERTKRSVDAALARGGDFHFEFRIRRGDGVVRWLSSIGRVDLDAAGAATRMAGINVDITDRRRIEEHLRRGEREFRAMFQLAAAGAAQADPESGRLLKVNATLCAITGYREEELLRMRFWEMTHPEDRELGADGLRRMLRGETDQWRAEKRYLRKDGELRWVIVSCCIVRDEEGRPWRAAAFIVDITERRRTERELEEVQARLREHAARLEQAVAARTAALREANEQLETLVYTVAHDLRGPLRALAGFAQLLVEDYGERLDENGRHMLDRIQGSSEFMDRLVLDLLAFGRAARAEMETGAVSVAKAWEAAWFQCAVEAEQTRARVEVDEPLPTVRANEATLGQALANLLSNALKFAKPGEAPRVRFWAEERGERVRLWMEDEGIGIPPEQHERVFRVFERLHGSRYEGTGVGLAIVRKGAERMGGRAGVESEPGKGSRFWIELPRA